MKRKHSIVIKAALAAVMTAAGSLWSAGAAHADTLWGVSFLGSQGYDGAQLWTADTTTGNVNMIGNYNPNNSSGNIVVGGNTYSIEGFGDIAQTANGDLYATVDTSNNGGNDGFNVLAKLNPSNGVIENAWTMSESVNALGSSGNNLYGVAGGFTSQTSPPFVQFTLDGSGNYQSLANHGHAAGSGMYSTGDIAANPRTGTWYGAFENSSTSGLWTINPTTGNGTLDTTTPLRDIAGLAFTSDGTLWAGTFDSTELYTINTANGGYTPQFDLSLGGNITGLSQYYGPTDTPEPTTLALFALGGLALMNRRRRQPAGHS